MTEAALVMKPEEGVRQSVIKELLRLGWRQDQLLWKPEWPVPNAPHDLTKRERGQKYN
jgi:type I restriction enzyme M protein